MKKWSSLVLLFISTQLYGQEPKKLHYEQLAIDYFADSIIPQQKKSRIMTSGMVIDQDMDVNYLKYLISRFYMNVIEKTKRNYKVNQGYLKEYNELNAAVSDTINLINHDSVNYQVNRLKIKRPLISRNLINYKYFKPHLIRNYGKEVYNFIFKDRYFLNISRQVYFDFKHWILINMNRPDMEYGRIFIIRINDYGEVIDYSETSWIQ